MLLFSKICPFKKAIFYVGRLRRPAYYTWVGGTCFFCIICFLSSTKKTLVSNPTLNHGAWNSVSWERVRVGVSFRFTLTSAVRGRRKNTESQQLKKKQQKLKTKRPISQLGRVLVGIPRPSPRWSWKTLAICLNLTKLAQYSSIRLTRKNKWLTKEDIIMRCAVFQRLLCDTHVFHKIFWRPGFLR